MYVSCNNENNLKLTLKFILAKCTFIIILLIWLPRLTLLDKTDFRDIFLYFLFFLYFYFNLIFVYEVAPRQWHYECWLSNAQLFLVCRDNTFL